MLAKTGLASLSLHINLYFPPPALCLRIRNIYNYAHSVCISAGRNWALFPATPLLLAAFVCLNNLIKLNKIQTELEVEK